MTTIPRDFWLAVRREPHRTRIAAGGRLVSGHGAGIELWLPYITAAAGQSIEIDLGGVTEIDARGLGLLLELAYCAEAGSTLRFVRASARVLRLVRLMGLDAVLPFPATAPSRRGRPGTTGASPVRRTARRQENQIGGAAGRAWCDAGGELGGAAFSPLA